jgi:hypothetical protein
MHRFSEIGGHATFLGFRGMGLGLQLARWSQAATSRREGAPTAGSRAGKKRSVAALYAAALR